MIIKKNSFLKYFLQIKTIGFVYASYSTARQIETEGSGAIWTRN